MNAKEYYYLINKLVKTIRNPYFCQIIFKKWQNLLNQFYLLTAEKATNEAFIISTIFYAKYTF